MPWSDVVDLAALLLLSLILALPLWRLAADPAAALYRSGGLLLAALPPLLPCLLLPEPGLYRPAALPLVILSLIALAGLVVWIRHGLLHLRLFFAGLVAGPLPFLAHLAVAGPAVAAWQDHSPGLAILWLSLPLVAFLMQGPLFSALLAARPDPVLAEALLPFFDRCGLARPLLRVSRLPLSAPNAWLLGHGPVRPRLVLGPGLVAAVPAAGLAALTLHEAGHLAAGDNAAAWHRNLVFFLLQSVFTPLAAAAARQNLTTLILTIGATLASALVLGLRAAGRGNPNRELRADRPALAAGLAAPLRETLLILWQQPQSTADDDPQLPAECRERLAATRPYLPETTRPSDTSAN